MKECPKCFAPHSEAGLACSAPHCERAGIPLREEDLKYDPKGDAICPTCSSRLTTLVCKECGFAMNTVRDSQQTVSISLVGEQGSGKSCLLATMLQQMGSEFGWVYGATLYPTGGDRTMAQYERLYYRPLFEQGVCVAATEPGLDPMTYALVFGPDTGTGKSVGLTFYDSCGGSFSSEQEMAHYNRSLYHSGGILFLIDPRQFAIPREALKSSAKGKKKGGPHVEADPTALLLRTIHLLRTGLSIDGVDKKIPIPIAVCLTKMDTMFPHLDKATFLSDPSRHLRRPMLSGADLSSCNLETQSLIESWGGRELIAHVKSQFAESCFFGFSALGGQPGEQNEIPRVAPHRVLDPLLWLLWKKGVLKTG